ncbi:MAG: hypothetical protein AB8B96_16240 [Lysobacterales bacterium]
MGIVAQTQPLIADMAGVWEGEYVHVDLNHQEFDRHQSQLLVRLHDQDTDDAPGVIKQTNIYTWADGEQEVRYFEGDYHDGHIRLDNELITGWTGAISLDPTGRTLMVGWTRPSEPGFRYYEIITVSEDGESRNRTWHWYRKDRLFQRTLINERRTSRDWQSYDQPHFYKTEPRSRS